MRLVITSICVLVLSQAALAQYSSHTFEIGSQLFNYDYQEVWPPPRQSNESGFIPGISLGYTYRGYAIPI